MSAAESLFSEIGNYPLAPKTRRFLTEGTFGHFIDGEVVVPGEQIGPDFLACKTSLRSFGQDRVGRLRLAVVSPATGRAS